MDVFVLSRDTPDSGPLRDDLVLLEEHWSYTDGFAETMIARGPLLAADRDTATGSVHVLGLPSVEAARAFVDREPNNGAGMYAAHEIWRFENLLGRTMWEFTRSADEPRFLVVARSGDDPVPAERVGTELRERLIVYGALSTLDDGEPVGVALAVQAPDRAAVETIVAEGLALDAAADVEVHDWEFGGRR